MTNGRYFSTRLTDPYRSPGHATGSTQNGNLKFKCDTENFNSTIFVDLRICERSRARPIIFGFLELLLHNTRVVPISRTIESTIREAQLSRARERLFHFQFNLDMEFYLFVLQKWLLSNRKHFRNNLFQAYFCSRERIDILRKASNCHLAYRAYCLYSYD